MCCKCSPLTNFKGLQHVWERAFLLSLSVTVKSLVSIWLRALHYAYIVLHPMSLGPTQPPAAGGAAAPAAQYLPPSAVTPPPASRPAHAAAMSQPLSASIASRLPRSSIAPWVPPGLPPGTGGAAAPAAQYLPPSAAVTPPPASRPPAHAAAMSPPLSASIASRLPRSSIASWVPPDLELSSPTLLPLHRPISARLQPTVEHPSAGPPDDSATARGFDPGLEALAAAAQAACALINEGDDRAVDDADDAAAAPPAGGAAAAGASAAAAGASAAAAAADAVGGGDDDAADDVAAEGDVGDPARHAAPPAGGAAAGAGASAAAADVAIRLVSLSDPAVAMTFVQMLGAFTAYLLDNSAHSRRWHLDAISTSCDRMMVSLSDSVLWRVCIDHATQAFADAVLRESPPPPGHRWFAVTLKILMSAGDSLPQMIHFDLDGDKFLPFSGEVAAGVGRTLIGGLTPDSDRTLIVCDPDGTNVRFVTVPPGTVGDFDAVGLPHGGAGRAGAVEDAAFASLSPFASVGYHICVIAIKTGVTAARQRVIRRRWLTISSADAHSAFTLDGKGSSDRDFRRRLLALGVKSMAQFGPPAADEAPFAWRLAVASASKVPVAVKATDPADAPLVARVALARWQRASAVPRAPATAPAAGAPPPGPVVLLCITLADEAVKSPDVEGTAAMRVAQLMSVYATQMNDAGVDVQIFQMSNTPSAGQRVPVGMAQLGAAIHGKASALSKASAVIVSYFAHGVYGIIGGSRSRCLLDIAIVEFVDSIVQGRVPVYHFISSCRRYNPRESGTYNAAVFRLPKGKAGKVTAISPGDDYRPEPKPPTTRVFYEVAPGRVVRWCGKTGSLMFSALSAALARPWQPEPVTALWHRLSLGMERMYGHIPVKHRRREFFPSLPFPT